MRLGKRERALARLLSAKRLKVRQHPKPTVGKYATAWSRMRGAGRPAGLRGQSWRWDGYSARNVRKGLFSHSNSKKVCKIVPFDEIVFLIDE